MALRWRRVGSCPGPATALKNLVIPDHPGFVKLHAYAEIGYLKGVKNLLSELETDSSADTELMDYLNHLAREARLEKMADLLEENS